MIAKRKLPDEVLESCLNALALCGQPAEVALRQSVAGPGGCQALEILKELGFGARTAEEISLCLGAEKPEPLRLAALAALAAHPLAAATIEDAIKEAAEASNPATVRSFAERALAAIEEQRALR